MHISLETRIAHTIQAYDDHQILVNETPYQDNIILDASTIISPWKLAKPELSPDALEPILQLKPEVILIGCNNVKLQPIPSLMQSLVQSDIGLEVMNIGSACRTFNVLLQESRRVCLGIVFNS